jgi:hypothetical protein
LAIFGSKNNKDWFKPVLGSSQFYFYFWGGGRTIGFGLENIIKKSTLFF